MTELARKRVTEYGYLLLLVLLTRVPIMYFRNSQGLPAGDGSLYLLYAESIRSGAGWLAPESAGRFFPGFSALIAGLSWISPLSAASSAYLLVLLFTWLASSFFQALWGNFALSCLFVVCLPSWYMSTIILQPEALVASCLLAGILALRDRQKLSKKSLPLFLLCGLGGLVHPVFALFLLLFVIRVLKESLSPRDSLAKIILLITPLSALALVGLMNTGIFFPQLLVQAQTFAAHTARSQFGYPDTSLSFPGYSLLLGFFDPAITSSKKVLNALHIFIVLWAARIIFAERKESNYTRLAYMLYFPALLLICSIGGPFGHSLFYRYVALLLNPLIIGSLAFRYKISVWLIILAGAIGAVGACISGTVGPY